MKKFFKALFALGLAIVMPVMAVTSVSAESLPYEKVIDSVTQELTEVEECLGTEYYINGTQVSGPIAVGTYLDGNYNSCDQQNASWKVVGDDSAEKNKQVVSESTELTGVTETLVAIEYRSENPGIIVGDEEEGTSTPSGEVTQIRHYERIEYYTKKTSYKIIVNIQVESVTRVPEQPTEPETPEKPGKPVQPSKPSKYSGNVPTGVTSNITLWLGMMMASLVSIIVIRKEN